MKTASNTRGSWKRLNNENRLEYERLVEALEQ